MRDNWFKVFKLKFLKPVNKKVEKEKVEEREQDFFYHYN